MKKEVVFIFVGLILSISFVSAFSFGEWWGSVFDKTTVSGRVADTSSGNADIYIYDPDKWAYSTAANVTLFKDGISYAYSSFNSGPRAYQFFNLPVGTYDAIYHVEGYSTTTNYSSVVVSVGATTTKVFYLKHSTIVCGDGKKEDNEVCDDGNTANGDGCSATCTVEAPVVTCVDSDANLNSDGKNWIVKGSVALGNIKHDDVCVGDTLLKERFCVGGVNETILKDCSEVGAGYICKDAACISQVALVASVPFSISFVKPTPEHLSILTANNFNVSVNVSTSAFATITINLTLEGKTVDIVTLSIDPSLTSTKTLKPYEITFDNLAPGNYLLFVEAKNSSGTIISLPFRAITIESSGNTGENVSIINEGGSNASLPSSNSTGGGVGGGGSNASLPTSNSTGGGVGGGNVQCKDGCNLDGKCIPYGTRKTGQYCSVDAGVMVDMKAENAVCENHYECGSNVCLDGKCVESGLIQKFIEWLKRLFGSKVTSTLVIERDIGNFVYEKTNNDPSEIRDVERYFSTDVQSGVVAEYTYGKNYAAQALVFEVDGEGISAREFHQGIYDLTKTIDEGNVSYVYSTDIDDFGVGRGVEGGQIVILTSESDKGQIGVWWINEKADKKYLIFINAKAPEEENNFNSFVDAYLQKYPTWLVVTEEIIREVEASDYFPKKLGDYSLVDIRQEVRECKGTICVEGERAEYRETTSGKGVFVNLWDVTEGTELQLKEQFAQFRGGTLDAINVGPNKLYRVENHELVWFTGKDYPAVVFTQEFTFTINKDGTDYSYGTATGINAVTSNLLAEFPSVEVN